LIKVRNYGHYRKVQLLVERIDAVIMVKMLFDYPVDPTILMYGVPND